MASSLVPSFSSCNSSSWLLPSWLVDLSFQSCYAFLFINNESSFPGTSFALPQCQGPEGQARRCAYDPSGCQLQLGRFSIGHVGGTYRWRHQGVLLFVSPVGLGFSGSSSMVGGEREESTVFLMKWSVHFRDVMHFRGVWETSSFQNRREPIATCLSDTVLIADALGTSNQTSQSFSHLPLGMPRPYWPCTICPTTCLFGMFMSNWKSKTINH